MHASSRANALSGGTLGRLHLLQISKAIRKPAQNIQIVNASAIVTTLMLPLLYIGVRFARSP